MLGICRTSKIGERKYCGIFMLNTFKHNLITTLFIVQPCRYLWGPLHYASTSGQLAVVDFLLTRCLEAINLRDKDGTTAAYRAKVNRHLVVEERLLSIANDPDILLVNNDPNEVESEGIDEPVYAKSAKFGHASKSLSNGNVTGGSQEPVYAQPGNIVRQGSARKLEIPDVNGESKEPVYAQPEKIVRQGSARKLEKPDVNGGYSEIFVNGGREPFSPEEKYLEPKKTLAGIVKGNAQSDVNEMVRNMVKSQLGNLQRMMDTGVLNEHQVEDPYEIPRNVEDSSLSIDLVTLRLILKQEFVEFVIDRNMTPLSPRIGDSAKKTQVIRRNSSHDRKHPIQEHPSTIYEEIISVLQTTLKKSKKLRTNGPALPDRKASFVKSKKDENDNEDARITFVRSDSRLKSNGSGIGEVLVLNGTSVVSQKSSSDV